MSELRSDRENLLNVVERRAGVGRLEFREDKKSGQVILEGYAATYDPYDCHGGPHAGGWVEQLSSRAFDATLAEQPDVQLLVNHGGTPLARTKSGTLKLTRDGHGLLVWASLDASDPDVQALIPKMRRKDMDEMSFAFRVTDQSWDHSYTNRTINSLSLEKGDVSIVNYGMNPGTKAVIADAVGALAQLGHRELVELRKLDADQVKRAVAALSTITGTTAKRTKRASGSDEPYGDVKYADPGYKSDAKKRYPIDSKEHAKAAWSYINMPKNQKGYTATQVNSIKTRVKGALKKFGVDVSADDQKKRGISPEGQALLDALTKIITPDGVRAKEGLKGNDDEDWDPDNVETEDPHNSDYEVGDFGLVGAGPVPDNIMGGNFPDQQPAFSKPSPQGDPHDESFNTEEQLSMDPHDGSLEFGPYAGGSKVRPSFGDFNGEGGGGDPHETPYALGGQVGNVPNDRPNVGGGDPGRVADNVVTTGGNGKGGNTASPGTAPSVGTEPVNDPGHQAYDWTKGTLEPSDPAEELDAAVRAMEEAEDPHDAATLGGSGAKFHTGGWEPTNIEGGTMKKAEGDGGGDRVELQLDLGMVEALERTLSHCYALAEGSTEVRETLVTARKQLYALAGRAPKPKATKAGPTQLQQRMAEMQKEVGDLNTGTVGDYLKHLRSAGSAPVGYRGLFEHDPSLHVTTPGERLAKEAEDKRQRARVAAEESDTAAARLKAAQREAQLNDVIRRHNIPKGV